MIDRLPFVMRQHSRAANDGGIARAVSRLRVRGVIGALVVGAGLCTISASSVRSAAFAQSALPLATPVQMPWEKVLPGPITDYEIMTATGGQNKEYLLRTAALSAEGFRFVQKAGRSGQDMKPWLLLRNAHTQHGIAVSLAYSGNWRMEVQPRGGQTLLRVAASPATLRPFDSIAGLPIPGAGGRVHRSLGQRRPAHHPLYPRQTAARHGQGLAAGPV